MRILTILSLLLLASPVFGQLTKEDLRTIVKEENDASEKRMKEYIDLKVETVNARIDAVNTRIDGLEKSMDGRFDDIGTIMIALIGLIAAAIAIPQIIIAYRDRGQPCYKHTTPLGLKTRFQVFPFSPASLRPCVKLTQVASRIEKPSFSRSTRLIVGKWVGFCLKSCAFHVKNSVFDA